MSENNASPVGGYVTAFVVGALAGAGISLLYAPRSGKETRELLAEKARRLQGKARESLEEAKGFIDSKREVLTAAFTAAKDEAREEATKHPRSI